MQSAIQSPSISGTAPTIRPPEQNLEFPGRFQRHITSGGMVFQPGEQRRLYRVESGAVCHYMRSFNGAFEVIEVAFPGDIIGLGRLPTHVSAAKAMVKTCVSIITDADLGRALSNDSCLSFRIIEAGEREFEYQRSRLLGDALLPADQRVANYLLAIISINVWEGREPLIVADDVSSGFVASQLHMSVDTLAMALLKLRADGIVDVAASDLRIRDISKLEAMAAGAFDPSAGSSRDEVSNTGSWPDRR